jgi:ribosome maturation factor RimP
MTSDLESVVNAELETLGYGLVLLRRGGTRSRPVLEIRIDRQDGRPVTVGDCATASRAIEARLDVAVEGAPVLGSARYELQVSSPGDARRRPAAGEVEERGT